MAQFRSFELVFSLADLAKLHIYLNKIGKVSARVPELYSSGNIPVQSGL